VSGGTWAVYFSDTLAVEGVEVRGLASLTEDDVLAVADVPTGDPLATVDLTAIDRRVSALAAVASARVTRQWPHDVLIEVTERVPVAVVDRGDGLRAVDAEGAVFSSYRRAPSDLPRIATTAVTDLEALREAAVVAAALPDDLRALVDHIEVTTVDEIDLVLRDRRRVRWGSADRSEQKAEVLAALLPRRAEVINVSVPGQPTTR
jgi:cell division protein FtsQ